MNDDETDRSVDVNKNLLLFLKILQENGMLKSMNKSGAIVYADDQYVNRQALKMAFLQDFGLAHRL